ELIAALDAALSDAVRGERVRDGYRIVLIGETNAGKSSLFNALVAREAAIVTPIPGTTRDVLDAELSLGGYRAILSDTAGLRDSDDMVEAEGVRRARARAEAADLRLWVRAPGDPEGAAAEFARPDDLVVWTKADLGFPAGQGVSVSVTTGAGLETLRAALTERVTTALSGADFPPVTRARHRRRLEAARTAVLAARDHLADAPEFAGEDLRRAAEAIASVTGAVGVEEILGEVFANFCIGK
ncbi:MAG: GTPase, partial [Brevundimonas sp.]